MKDNFLKNLRTHGTDAESILWYHLRAKRLRGKKFRRQVPLLRYVVDFVCFEKMLIIELDGGQHQMQKRKDEKRTLDLHRLGYRVLRFWNIDIMQNLEGVLEVIERELN